ncbi:methionine aminopeptidase [Salipaludibacillus sp. HK11]|uniref:methionine aminopeptidase n=1 Tax=Salipaludibacillus sp. HK11 TaxID=3394320 RepID=UPI0039FD4F3D
MGLFQAVSDWNTARQEKRLDLMKEKDLCPECHGRGFNIPISEFYLSSDYYECPGCSGSGRYFDRTGK